mmetsp:Transcript_56329/g.123397  ORF Transcript_56329/g.123397 Transcript_56329/m.123397 type:complete len:275 (+) Transcript_56329:48-872(+)
MASAVRLGPRFHSVMAAAKEAGLGRLVVISDFDQTLTMYTGKDGKPAPQCHEIMLRHLQPPLPPCWPELVQWHGLTEPQRMEICENDPQKRADRTQWFFDKFVEADEGGILDQQVSQCVEACSTQLRGGVAELVQWLGEKGVPLLIVSAGLQEVIAALLQAAALELPPTAQIVSNSFASPTVSITSRTKAASLTLVPEALAAATGRFVICLGDKPSDLDPLKGLGEDVVALKIGFSKPGATDVEVQEYLDTFDVVIPGDPGVDFVLDLVKGLDS